jgi:ankyrin repeat protein
LVKAVESGSVEAVISLLKGGDRPDYVFGRASWTPLIVAADRKHVDIIEALLEHGADPNLAEGDGWTPIMFSIIKNDMPSVRALLRAGARLDHVSKNEWTPLKAAQRAGTAMVDFVKQETVRSKELSVDNVAHNKAFLGAVREGDIEQVRDMLNRGMNPNVLSSNGWNAATYAASSGNAKLLILLVRRGVQVNKPDKDGWTPIMFAAFQVTATQTIL